MKKFTKLFLSCAAMAAITAAVATSAMAAESLTGDLAGTYDAGTLTITAPADMDQTKEATLLVYDASKDRASLQDADIVGIDQSTAGVAFTNAGVMGAPTENTALDQGYVVALGYYTSDGSFAIKTGKLFSSASILIGDTDLSGGIDLDDATAIVMHKLQLEILTDPDALVAADVDGSGGIDLDDATCIVMYKLQLEGSGNAGQIK